jgi:uncharacterized phiE125 gp8 family phage protein
MWDQARPLESMHNVRHSSRVSVGPTVEPVSVEELKAHSRVDHNHEDAKIADYLQAARVFLEKDTRRAFCTQTRVLYLDYLPAHIVLDVAPIQSITSITYYDSLNTQQTLASTVYESDIYAEPAIIRPAFGQTWPTTYDRFSAVAVTYVAGYGLASAVPQDAKQAIRMLAASWLENSENILTGTISKEIEFSYSALRDRLKWGGYA